MTNQLDKPKKWEDNLSSHLEQRHKSLNKLEAEIGEYKEEVSALRSKLEEARKQAQGTEKIMESLVIIGHVDEAKKEKNTMICQIKAKDEEILKLKFDLNLLKAETCKSTRIMEEMESSLAKENEEIFRMKSYIISLKTEENEVIRIKDEFEKQLAKKNNGCEILEEEIISLRKKVEGMDKFLKSSQALDDMLSD